jgi:curved DNA-binding protein
MGEPHADLYEVLGVRPNATAADIRRAYRDHARRLHPDVAGHRADGRMAEINDAWFVLRDPARRAAYDRTFLGPSPDPWTPVQPDWSGRDQHRLVAMLLICAVLIAVVCVALFLIGFGRLGT